MPGISFSRWGPERCRMRLLEICFVKRCICARSRSDRTLFKLENEKCYHISCISETQGRICLLVSGFGKRTRRDKWVLVVEQHLVRFCQEGFLRFSICALVREWFIGELIHTHPHHTSIFGGWKMIDWGCWDFISRSRCYRRELPISTLSLAWNFEQCLQMLKIKIIIKKILKFLSVSSTAG